MSKLTLDYETLAKLAQLRTATEPCELYDPKGNLIAYLTPTPGLRAAFPDIEIDYEEMNRRLNDPNAKWHTPEEVMARLRSLRKDK